MKTNNFKLSYAIAPVTMLVLLMTMLLVSLSGCYVYDQEYHHHGRDNQERGPMIEAVSATCHYNYSYNDYVWYFDAWVHYPRFDFEEVTDVFVDVYENGYLVDSFPLYHDREKYWQSSWIEMTSTHLWCGDWYEIEFVAYDYQGNYDVFSTTPYY